MSSFVEVLSPASDGRGWKLDGRLLEMLRAEATSGLPVVVLTVAGKRDATKSKLMSDVQQAVAEAAGKSTGFGGPRTAAGYGSASPVGVATWSELLPVTLPDGQRAVLLLLDVGGPFQADCPEHQRASLLLFSALVSSTLVAHFSAGNPIQLMTEMQLLSKLAAAAQEARHCEPLQHLVLLLRDYQGRAAPGRQTNIQPLIDWLNGAGSDAWPTEEAVSWYGHENVSLFLAADHAPATDADADPVGMLAKMQAARQLLSKNVTAGELADYIEHLVEALETGNGDAKSALDGLVKGNQTLAAKAARPVYDQKMEQLKRQCPSPFMTEQELQSLHSRAAHEALMTFTISKKMDNERVDGETAKKGLERWLQEQYEQKLEALTNERKMEDDTSETVDTYTDEYERLMQERMATSPEMTLGELVKIHEEHKRSVLSRFDESQKGRRSYDQQRMNLCEKLESLFRQFANKQEEAKEKEADAAKARELASDALVKAELFYRNIMKAVERQDMQAIHEGIQECAILKFDSEMSNWPEKDLENHANLKKRTEDIHQEIQANKHRRTVREEAPHGLHGRGAHGTEGRHGRNMGANMGGAIDEWGEDPTRGPYYGDKASDAKSDQKGRSKWSLSLPWSK